jgi:hypothetical protein
MTNYLRTPAADIKFKPGDVVRPVQGARDIKRRVCFDGTTTAVVAEIVGSTIFIDDVLNGWCGVTAETINKEE